MHPGMRASLDQGRAQIMESVTELGQNALAATDGDVDHAAMLLATESLTKLMELDAAQALGLLMALAYPAILHAQEARR